MSILEVRNLRKVYTTRFGGNKVEALSNVNFSVSQGEYVAIMGESGSGKTTLLNILAALPLVLSGMEYSEMNGRLKNLAASLGISGLLKKYPYEVSGGQKQRAAVARALITQPKLILADEPTGALDSRSTDDLLNLFHSINQTGQTIVMVTHSARAASHASRVLFIRDGQVFHQLYRAGESSGAFYETISDTLTMLLRGGEQA